MKFSCSQCGECCRNLDKSSLYDALDRGDGVCKFLQGNLCGIYEQRPLLCRVEESYYAFFRKFMSKEVYYKLNYEACKILKEKEV